MRAIRPIATTTTALASDMAATIRAVTAATLTTGYEISGIFDADGLPSRSPGRLWAYGGTPELRDGMATASANTAAHPRTATSGLPSRIHGHTAAVSYTHLRAHETVLDLVC